MPIWSMFTRKRHVCVVLLGKRRNVSLIRRPLLYYMAICEKPSLFNTTYTVLLSAFQKFMANYTRVFPVL